VSYKQFFLSLKFWQKIVLAFVILILFFYPFKLVSLHKSKTPVVVNKLVEVITLKRQSIEQKIHLLGTIHPKHTTTLISKGAGTFDALINTGQQVAKGSLIAVIANTELEKNLSVSQSAEQLAKEQFERFAPLIKKKFVSPREVEEKKQAWFAAQKEYTKAKIELDNLRFYAPFNGIVGAYKHREGAQVNLGDAIVSVYDPSSVLVDFDIPCSNLPAINEGQTVYISNKKYTLTHMQKMLDEATHMCPADVDIVCEQCLIGATVRIDLVVAAHHDTLVIPVQALFLRDGVSTVYVVENNKVKQVSVKTGLKQENQIEVIEGLAPGQQLIIKGQDRLYPDMSVDIYSPTKAN